MDELKISDRALDESATSLKKYCSKQVAVMEDFLHRINSLSSEWDSPHYAAVLSSSRAACNLASQAFASIEEKVSKYLSQKVELFRTRPAFNGGARTSASSSGMGGSSGSANENRSIKTVYDKLFQNHHKDLLTRIEFYLRKIRIYPLSDQACFYDPDGLYKNGFYKNIMALDINSERFESDLLFLTGQHLFFQVRRETRADLLRSLTLEMKSRTIGHEKEFSELVQRIKTGKDINYRYLQFSSGNEKASFNFFAYCFRSLISDDKPMINQLNRFFPNSYGYFKTMLIEMGNIK